MYMKKKKTELLRDIFIFIVKLRQNFQTLPSLKGTCLTHNMIRINNHQNQFSSKWKIRIVKRSEVAVVQFSDFSFSNLHPAGI